MLRRILAILPLSLAACEVGGDLSLDRPPVEEVPAPTKTVDQALCASSGDAPERVVLALIGPRSLTLVRADGSRLPAPVEVSSAEDEAHYYRVQSRGDFIAVAAGGARDAQSVTALLDRRGALLWQQEHPGALLLPDALSDKGDLIVSRYHEDSSRSDYVVFNAAGQSYVMSDFRPMGPPNTDGWVLGVRISDEQPGWQKEQEFRALETVTEHLSLHRYGERFMYLTEGITVPWLMFSDMSDSDSVFLWDLEGVQARDIQVQQWQEPWLLIQDRTSERYFRIHAETGVAEPLEQSLPEGLRPLDPLACQPRPQLASDGNVVMQARNDASMQVLSGVPGEAWSVLGSSLTEVEMVEVQEAAGTFAIVGFHKETFCPPMAWAPSDDAVAGRSLQLIRPEADAAWLLPQDARWGAMNKLGLCAAYWAEGEAKVMDVVTGVEAGLGSTGGMIWLD